MEKDVTLEELIYQSLGEASMCWSKTPQGVFDSEHAVQIGKRLEGAIKTELERVRVAVLENSTSRR